MSSSTWVVSYFKVQTSTTNGTSDSEYANGNMQVPVYVYIKATISTESSSDDESSTENKSSRYTLSDAQLQTIKLVDYNDVSKEISGDWQYTDTENEFDHSLGSTSSSAIVKADSDDSPQSICYWVSTTKVESKNIGASIKQGDGTTVTTHGSDYDSHVTITGVQPITYTTANINIKEVDGDSGKYVWGRTTNGEKGSDTKKDWNQKNWYISTSQYDLKRADVWADNNYDTSGDDQSRPDLDKCYAFRTNHDNLKLFYIFNMTDSSPRDFGFDNSWDWTFTDDSGTYNVHDTADAVVNAKINQKANTLNLSRFHFEHSGDTDDLPWGGGNNPDPDGYDEWYFSPVTFQLWDRCGNTGTLNASYDPDHDKVVIDDPSSTGTSNGGKHKA